MDIKNYLSEFDHILNKYENELKNNNFRMIYRYEFRETTGRVLIQALIDLGYSPEQIIDKMNEEDPKGADKLKISLFQDITFPEKFRSIILPKEVETLLENTFSGSNLKFINMMNVKSINYYAFKECKDLEEITLGDKIEAISLAAFEGCNKLKTIYYKGTEQSWNKKFGRFDIAKSNPKVIFVI